MPDIVETVVYSLLIAGAAGIIFVSLYGAFRCFRVNNYLVAIVLLGSLAVWFVAYAWLLPIFLWATATNYPTGMNPAEIAVAATYIIASALFCFVVLRYLDRATVYRKLEVPEGESNPVDDEYSGGAGVTAVALHFVLGALFGGLIWGGVFWMFVIPSAFLQIVAASALVFGVAAAIGRKRFWCALVNNPLFQAWRRLMTGRR